MHWSGGCRYRVLCILGKTTFHTIYKLADTENGRSLAAKEYARKFTKFLDMQIHLRPALLHDNIARYLGYHAFEDHHYILEEYAPYGTLGNFLGLTNVLSETVAKRLGRQTLGALSYLHGKGIIHRNIAPTAILIASVDPFIIKVSDLDLMAMGNDEEELRTFCGTLLYCAPEVYPQYEQFLAKYNLKRPWTASGNARTNIPSRHGISFTVDIWSFAVVLWHSLCATHPFRVRADKTGSGMLEGILETELRSDPLKEYETSDTACDLVFMMLNIYPSLRPTAKMCLQHPWFSEDAKSSTDVIRYGLQTGLAAEISGSGTGMPTGMQKKRKHDQEAYVDGDGQLDVISDRLSNAESISSRALVGIRLSEALIQTTDSSKRKDVIRPTSTAFGNRRQIGEGEHLDYKSREELPYVHVKHLGMGSYGTVDMVKDLTNGRYFARKILRKRYNEDFDSVRIQFLNEIRILASLSARRHIIRIFASYSFDMELALILEPIADSGSLAQFLYDISCDKERRPNCEDRKFLQRSFGCLASTLAFVHQKQVRHKDVSPGNILVHEKNVILSDFGIAIDCTMLSRTTTTGIPGPANHRYSAPEVLAGNGARNRKSDVFSLGSVFVDIVSILDPGCIPMDKTGSFYSQKAYSICSVMADQVTDELNPLSLPKVVLKAISLMLRVDMSQRPTAEDIVLLLSQNHCLFCTDCAQDIPVTRRNISS